MKKYLLPGCALSLLLMTPRAQAALMTADYHVIIDTASIAADSHNLDDPPLPGDAPFSFYVELNSGGSGTAPNSVLLTNFNFGSGSPGDPSSIQTINNVSGTLASGVALNDNIPGSFNSFQEEFAAGNTLSFDLSTTTNGIDPNSSDTPDGLSIQIFDSGGWAVGTLVPDPSDSLIEIEYQTPLQISSYASDPNQTTSTGQSLVFSAPLVTSVPEPGLAIPFTIALGFGIGFRQRKPYTASAGGLTL